MELRKSSQGDSSIELRITKFVGVKILAPPTTPLIYIGMRTIIDNGDVVQWCGVGC